LIDAHDWVYTKESRGLSKKMGSIIRPPQVEKCVQAKKLCNGRQNKTGMKAGERKGFAQRKQAVRDGVTERSHDNGP
jgi:hypothetical protein